MQVVQAMNFIIKPDQDIERKVWLARNPRIISRLAEQLDVSPSMVYGVLKGRRRSRRVSAALAAAGAPGFQESPNARKQSRRKQPAA